MSDAWEQAAVVPNFWLEAVEPLRDFYMEKLGFKHMMGIVGKDGKLDFAIVTLDRALLMMGRPQGAAEGVKVADASRPIELYVYVKDVDTYYALVREKVRIDSPLQTQWWGDRNFSVKDPCGYTLWFGQTVGQLQPPPGVKMI